MLTHLFQLPAKYAANFYDEQNKADMMCDSTDCPQLPRHLSGLFSPLICTLKSSYSLSPPISHVHKPTLTLDLEQNVFSAATIVMFRYESPDCRGGVRQDAGRESRPEQCYGNSPLRLHFWKTDLWVITLNS